MTDFNWRANLEPCYLIFSRYCGVDKLKEFYEELDYDYDLTDLSAHTRCEHFLLFFSTSAASMPNLFLITEIIVMISEIAFDRPHPLNHLTAFPYDRFNMYTIVPIVRIELNSIQAIRVF